ncbi:MAG TPA: hypothetical protein VI855_09930 [Dehalococcoidia bacterium]|nr:hypothetical protein [Dehalococcoidia bacterium]
MPAYLLRPGTTPGIALYTRCEDELLCRAELLSLLEKTSRDAPQDQQVSGYYDVDATYTIARFKRGYRGRARDYQRLMAMRSRVIAEGWPFPELPRTEDPGAKTGL